MSDEPTKRMHRIAFFLAANKDANPPPTVTAIRDFFWMTATKAMVREALRHLERYGWAERFGVENLPYDRWRLTAKGLDWTRKYSLAPAEAGDGEG